MAVKKEKSVPWGRAVLSCRAEHLVMKITGFRFKDPTVLVMDVVYTFNRAVLLRSAVTYDCTDHTITYSVGHDRGWPAYMRETADRAVRSAVLKYLKKTRGRK